jgi:fibronectin-binding autotransporter adhesin
LGVAIYTTGWSKYIITSNLLVPTKGYAANMGNLTAAKTVVISGVVNNDIVTTQTLYNNNRTYTKGFNLVGNPYPSPIDWNASSGWTKTNIDNALYFFDNGTTDQYTGTYSSYVNGFATGAAGNIIASMQGFFIHVSNGVFPVTAALGLDNRVRVNNLSPVFHKSAYAQNQPIIRIAAAYENEKTTDPAIVYFDELASTSFDPQLDALKLLNTDVTVPNLYALTPQADRLSISSTPFPVDSISKYPLGIKTEKSDWVVMSAASISDLPSGLRVYLSDEATGMIQDLQINPQYRVYLNSGTVDNRFSLLFSKKDLTTSSQDGDIFYAYIESSQLNMFVKLATGNAARLVISNMLGQIVLRDDNFTDGLHQINQFLPSGMYILTLHSESGLSSIKIYIPK